MESINYFLSSFSVQPLLNPLPLLGGYWIPKFVTFMKEIDYVRIALQVREYIQVTSIELCYKFAN